MTDMPDFLKEHLEGSDVVTIVGIAIVERNDGQLAQIPTVIADYAGQPEWEEWIDRAWENDPVFSEPVTLTIDPDDTIHVASTVKQRLEAYEGDQTHIVESPAYWVKAEPNDGSPKFRVALISSAAWVFHIMTSKYSFLRAFSYPEGIQLMRLRKERMDIQVKGEIS
mgnify:CR=1 FL=1